MHVGVLGPLAVPMSAELRAAVEGARRSAARNAPAGTDPVTIMDPAAILDPAALQNMSDAGWTRLMSRLLAEVLRRAR